MIEHIFKILSKQRFCVESEKETQKQISDALTHYHVVHKREFALDKSNIIDFLIKESGVGIEVKIKGQKMAIYKQCERYCTFDEVKSLILITSKSMGMLEEINGKPIFVINISKAWL